MIMRGRGLGLLMDCGASYWTARGNVGKDLCSPLDQQCIAAAVGAISQFNDRWAACPVTSDYLTLAQQTQDPNVLSTPTQQHLSAVQTASPVVPLSPHPASVPLPGGFTWPGQYPQYPFATVNPSPASLLTSVGTPQTSPVSAVSQANGATGTGADGGLVSTAGGYVTGGYRPATKDGMPDWPILAAGALAVLLLSQRR